VTKYSKPILLHPRSVTLLLLTGCITLFSEVALFASDLRVQDIQVSHDGVQLVWEGTPGGIYTIESAEYLAPYDTFAPLLENIPATEILTTNNFPLGPDPYRYFRVMEQGSDANRLGKVVLMSDFHMSPFLNRATTEALVTNDISLWDEYARLGQRKHLQPRLHYLVRQSRLRRPLEHSLQPESRRPHSRSWTFQPALGLDRHARHHKRRLPLLQ